MRMKSSPKVEEIVSSAIASNAYANVYFSDKDCCYDDIE